MSKTKATVAGVVAMAGVGGVMSLAQTAAPAAASWADKVTLKGDLRYRHEMIDEQGKDVRNRERIRVRLGVDAKVNDEVKAVVQMATGNDDPVSSNQTLDESFSRKQFGLDLGYVEYKPKALDGFTAYAGKMSKPWISVGDLVWDGDLNPEGAAVAHTLKGESLELMANGGAFWVDERSSASEIMLYAGQLAAKLKMDKDHALLGVGYYQYDDLEGEGPVYGGSAFGNSTRKVVDGGKTNLLFANGFEEIEVFGEIGLDLAMPVKLYGQYVVNQDADDYDTGFLAGVLLGKCKDPKSFEVGYNYRELEKNAVLGAFTDSDSFGGGTDGRGHKVHAAYQIGKNWQLAAAYFMQEKGISGTAKDYDRLQLDISAKF